jgi:hypothetical protein
MAVTARNGFVFDGLEDYRKALRNLPLELRDEAAAVVQLISAAAKAEIIAAYPKGKTGNLKAGVFVSTYVSPKTPSVGVTPGKGVLFGASAIVKNRAKHAWLYEYGSEARGLLRPARGRIANFGMSRGRMPAKPTFVPIVIRRRRDMERMLAEIVRRAGPFQVTGG